jgi:hypothetical protein
MDGRARWEGAVMLAVTATNDGSHGWCRLTRLHGR